MSLHEGLFNEGDLEKVNETACVVLASGGPLMHPMDYLNGMVLCRWHRNESYWFPLESLRLLINISEESLKEILDKGIV